MTQAWQVHRNSITHATERHDTRMTNQRRINEKRMTPALQLYADYMSNTLHMRDTSMAHA